MFSIFGEKKPDGTAVYNKTLVQQAFNSFPVGPFEMTIGVPKKKPRRPFWNYYFVAIVRPSAEYFGYEEDEMHSAFKEKFLRVESDGVKPAYVRSTKELDTAESRDFVEKIKRWMAQDFGVVLMDVNQFEQNV